MGVLDRIFHELLSRDRGDGCAIWQPQGIGTEAYLNSTSQGPIPEDARKDGHIIRARCAPLSPASGFPVSWSQQAIREISGLVLVILAEVARWRRLDIELIMRDINPAADARAFLGTTLCLGGTDNFNQ